MKIQEMLIVFAVALLPLGVNAAGDAAMIKERFDKLDANHDGYISQNEAKAHERLRERWSSADADKDGKLEASEFSAFEEHMMQNQMKEKNMLQNKMKEQNKMQHNMQQKNMAK
jgi:Ca2+-binding EF-hand superfamily protein